MALLVDLAYKVPISENSCLSFLLTLVAIFCFLLQHEVAKVLCISEDIWLYDLLWNVCMLLLG